MDFFLKPVEFTPASHWKECRLKAFLCLLYFSDLDAQSKLYTVHGGGN